MELLLEPLTDLLLSLKELSCKAAPGNVCPGKCSGARSGRGESGLLGIKGYRIMYLGITLFYSFLLEYTP